MDTSPDVFKLLAGAVLLVSLIAVVKLTWRAVLGLPPEGFKAFAWAQIGLLVAMPFVTVVAVREQGWRRGGRVRPWCCPS
jgi:hypothetical protein